MKINDDFWNFDGDVWNFKDEIRGMEKTSKDFIDKVKPKSSSKCIKAKQVGDIAMTLYLYKNPKNNEQLYRLMVRGGDVKDGDVYGTTDIITSQKENIRMRIYHAAKVLSTLYKFKVMPSSPPLVYTFDIPGVKLKYVSRADYCDYIEATSPSLEKMTKIWKIIRRMLKSKRVD